MSPEPTASERDTLALIAGIERASRRSRPFFLFGLLAVVLGFASVSVYLYQDRAEEHAQKVVLERQVAELNGTLTRARALLPELDDSAAARDQMRRLLRQATDTANALPAAVAAAESGAPAAPAVTPRPTVTPAPAPAPAEKAPEPPGRVEIAVAPKVEAPRPARLEGASDEIRFTIHLSEASQMPQARALAARLRHGIVTNQRRFRVSLVTILRAEPDTPPGDNSLRCFDFYACDWAEHVIPPVNGFLAGPRLAKRDMAQSLSGTGVIDYQIWFAPGPIRLTGR